MNPFGSLTEPETAVTFCMEYSRCCPSPFLIRLVGDGQGYLDKNSPYIGTKDILCYGKTLEEAVEKVEREIIAKARRIKKRHAVSS